MKKILCTLLALILILSLAACKNEPETPATDAKGQTLTVNTTGSVGSVLLIGENYLTLYYDEDGKIISIADHNGEAAYADLSGETCAKAVSHLLKKSDPPVFTNSLLLKQAIGSQSPNDSFLQSLATEAKLAVGDVVTVCPPEDQNEYGYFSAETAKAVLAAYLGNPTGATYVSTSAPVDGYYQVSCTMEGRIDEYTVGAFYGGVTLNTDYANEPGFEEEEIPEYFVDDGTNMNVTDNYEVVED